MYPLKIKPHRFFALGTACILSLTFLSIVLVIIASAQGDAPQAGGNAEVEAGQAPLQNGIVHIEPPIAVVENGETFRTHVMIYDAQDLGGFQFVINYDANVIEVVDPVILGDFIGSTNRTILEIKNDIGTAGIITYAVATLGPSPGPNGDGVLASVDLRARDLGVSALDLQDVMIADTTGHTQTVSVGDGRVVVAIPPDPARVSITKSVDPPTVAPQGVLTYTLQRSFSLAGNHTYDESVFDPIPGGTTCLPESVTLNGLPASQLYSTTLDAILYRHNDVFTDTDRWTLTFQVQVGDVPSGTLIVNAMTETTRFDAAAYSGPYADTEQVTVLTPASPPLWVYLPIVPKNYVNYAPPCSASNNYCEDYDTYQKAYGPLEPGIAYTAYPEDETDYYYFLTSDSASVTVRLTGYLAVGWLIVRTEDLTMIGYDIEDPISDGVLEVVLPSLSPGTYYIQVYTSSGHNQNNLYTLEFSN